MTVHVHAPVRPHKPHPSDRRIAYLEHRVADLEAALEATRASELAFHHEVRILRAELDGTYRRNHHHEHHHDR